MDGCVISVCKLYNGGLIDHPTPIPRVLSTGGEASPPPPKKKKKISIANTIVHVH